MPNYTTTIIKLFVRDELESMVPLLVSALSGEGLKPEGDDDGSWEWIDFRRLLPVPEILLKDGEHDNAAAMVISGSWPRNEELPDNMEGGREQMIAAFRSISPERAEAVDRILANISRYGVPNAHEWRTIKWGTKWNAESQEPRIEKTDQYDGYDDFLPSTMIHYRIVTAWSEPDGYLKALGRLCSQLGVGMRCWASHEDGGTEWDPETEEYRTRWEHLDQHDVEQEEMTASDMVALLGGKLEINADSDADTPVDPDNLFTRILEAMR